jgi:ribosome-associated protein
MVPGRGGGWQPGQDGPMRDVSIRDDSIRLGQLLKLADLIDAGSDAKALLADGQITVNGEVEFRRGRQLRRDDVVGFRGEQVRIA